MKKVYYPPTPLLSGYPPTPPEPAYDDVEIIIMELWDYCMYLEYQYFITNDKAILQQFAVCIALIQYWENVYFTIGGIHDNRSFF